MVMAKPQWLLASCAFVFCQTAVAASCAAKRRVGKEKGAVGRAWDNIEPECRDKLEKNRTAAAMRCLEGHFWEAREPGKRAGDFYTTLRKLRHDAEMFTWLEQEGKVKTEVKKLYRGVFHSARAQHLQNPDKVFELAFQEQTADRQLWQKANNKAVYWDPAGKEVPKKMLELREFGFVSPRIEASTFYFYPRGGFHLLALLEDGLASPLLAQVVDGLRNALPNVVGQHPLTGIKAWKADNSALPRSEGERPELAEGAHDAAVSVLVWVVPASALDGSAADALHLYPRGNGTESQKPEPLARVKYAANRAVFWGQDMEARWEGPSWKTGFLERGIHLLFSFGWSSDACEA